MAEKCATEDHVEIAILKSEKACREESDKRYAPSHVKLIVYSLLFTSATGVIFGAINSWSGNFIKAFGPDANNVQAYDDDE